MLLDELRWLVYAAENPGSAAPQSRSFQSSFNRTIRSSDFGFVVTKLTPIGELPIGLLARLAAFRQHDPLTMVSIASGQYMSWMRRHSVRTPEGRTIGWYEFHFGPPALLQTGHATSSPSRIPLGRPVIMISRNPISLVDILQASSVPWELMLRYATDPLRHERRYARPARYNLAGFEKKWLVMPARLLNVDASPPWDYRIAANGTPIQTPSTID